MDPVHATTLGNDRTVLSKEAVHNFAERLRGWLLHPRSGGYDEARHIWNGMIDREPALIARCAGTADVIASVHFAREHDLLLAVRGGGHHVAGTAVCDGGLVIDLSKMTGVRIDPEQQIARVQGGAVWADVDHDQHRHTDT